MRNRFRRLVLLALLTVAGAMAPASVAVAHPFFIEATGTGVAVPNTEQIVVFQCGAFDTLLVGRHITECYVISRGDGTRTDAQTKTQSLWVGIAFMQPDVRFTLCAGGYEQHPLGLPRQDIPTQCTVSAFRVAHLLLFGPP